MRKLTISEKVLLSVSVILCFVILHSEASATQWARFYTSFGYSIGAANSFQQTPDGKYVVACTIPAGMGQSARSAVLKLDGKGFIEWQEAFGGSANSIRETLDGGYVVVGGAVRNTKESYLIPMMGPPPPPPTDIRVLKLSGDGSVVWQKTYEIGISDEAYSVEQTSEGGYIAIGSSNLVLKLDSSGDIEWQKTYGNSYSDILNSIQQTSDGGYILAGNTSSSGGGMEDAWVVKLDKDGNIQWQKAYGGTGYNLTKSIQQTSDGGYIAAGYTSTWGAGAEDAWIVKLDKDGNIQWQKAYGGANSEGVNSILQTSDGGYIAAGWTSSFGTGLTNAWTLKLDSIGNIQWQKVYGNTGYNDILSIQQAPDGGYIGTGYYAFSEGIGGSSVVKLDSYGNIPDCSIIETSYATANDTEAIAKDTNAAGVDTHGVPQATDITPGGTDIMENTVCFFPSSQEITVNPNEIDFGTVLLGEYTEKVVTVTNGGSGDITVGKITTVGPFSIMNDHCSRHTLTLGGNCIVTVRFSPGHFDYGTYLGTLDIPFDGSLATVPLSGTGVSTITLSAPANQALFNGCSLTFPPTFIWDAKEFFQYYEIQFSPSMFNWIPVSIKVQAPSTQFTPSSKIWKDIMVIPGTSEGTIFWRVVGTRPDGTTEARNGLILIIEPPQPVQESTISPTGEHSKPTLTWQNNCNKKFKVVFGSGSSFTKKTTFAFNIKDPTVEGFSKTLTPGQWMAIKRQVKNTTGSTIYWYVESWDALGRYAKTDVMSFVLTD